MTRGRLSAIEDSDRSAAVELTFSDDGTLRRLPLSGCWNNDFENLPPINQPAVYHGQNRASGEWWAATNSRHIGFVSWVERDNLILLD